MSSLPYYRAVINTVEHAFPASMVLMKTFNEAPDVEGPTVQSRGLAWAD